MKVGQTWLFIYDTYSEKPSKLVGTITAIITGIIEVDGKYLINQKNIIRAERQDGEDNEKN